MKKWLALFVITGILLFAEFFFSSVIDFHPSFRLMIFFFAAQAFVLFRIDHWAPEEWKVQISMVKIVIRLLSSMAFILVLIYTQSDHYTLVVQFIILYLIYMIFEIVEALTNLRRN
ncbi:hypothetical protein [Ekhidna sp. To15]|uniref:hypothetical protein n=1 Tax=Ekhidna sp. To15 TaxID=3395267 RepID=UPI003F51BB51